jgi:hypothetical protein
VQPARKVNAVVGRQGKEGDPIELWKRGVAEFIGTFWLVFAGYGSAVLAAVFGAKLEGTSVDIGINPTACPSHRLHLPLRRCSIPPA